MGVCTFDIAGLLLDVPNPAKEPEGTLVLGASNPEKAGFEVSAGLDDAGAPKENVGAAFDVLDVAGAGED